MVWCTISPYSRGDVKFFVFVFFRRLIFLSVAKRPYLRGEAVGGAGQFVGAGRYGAVWRRLAGSLRVC